MKNTSEKIYTHSKYYSSVKILFFFFFFGLVLSSHLIYGKEGSKKKSSYITTFNKGVDFCIASGGRAAAICVNDDDYPGVIRAVNDLSNDITKVSSAEPKVLKEVSASGKNVIIVGTLGKSPLIEKLVIEKKLDASNLRGKWETFVIQTIKNPIKGIEEALVIAGSDKRGTIYGIYDLCENMGVSPWYWWGDVPVEKKKELYFIRGRYTLGEPVVKYRGLFINDEYPALGGWVYEKFGGFNHKFYTKVFELLLRLKANYLWPAMWNNNFSDEDSLNPKLADEYGIVMGTSHHEPMTRSWKEWPKYGRGAWNYQTNDTTLKEYWRNGIKRMQNYENIVTLGMRGDGDEEMSATANIGLLERIIADQRTILKDVTKKDVTSIPQVWALYKEVMEYYEKGLKAPEDVTLLFADDNWGNLRKLPKPDAPKRTGGYGIYYHYDYVGGPRNYKWLNTIQIERVWEQMRLAHKYGADKIWVVNVGDIKPLEFPISFFMDYAWNPDKIEANDLPEYYTTWVQKQFGGQYTKEIADILAAYTKYNSRIKPELLSPDTYSRINYREAETVVNDYNNLAKKASGIYDAIKPEYKDAYYQLVLYPVLSCANLNELYFSAAKNKEYTMQGRAAANSYAAKVRELFAKDTLFTIAYNKNMAGGKWNHMMDQTHIGYTYWQQPDKNNMPEVKYIELPEKAEAGIAVEGSNKWFPADSASLLLPQFDSFGKQSYYLELFNRSKTPFAYSLKPSVSWLKADLPEGKIEDEKRVFISIDWTKVPTGINIAKISVEINGMQKTEVIITADNRQAKSKNVEGFVESCGYVSIEAGDYSKITNKGVVIWQKIPGLGRTASAMAAVPAVAKQAASNKNNSLLEYKVYFFGSGNAKVNCYLSPTLKFHNTGIKYSIAFDDEEPQIINMTTNKNPADLNKDSLWNKWVSDNINIQSSTHVIRKPGLHVLKIRGIDPGVVLQKIVIDFGGAKPCYLGPPESINIVKKKQ